MTAGRVVLDRNSLHRLLRRLCASGFPQKGGSLPLPPPFCQRLSACRAASCTPSFMGWFVVSSASGSGIRSHYHATHIILSLPWQRALSVLTDLSERTLSIWAQYPYIIVHFQSCCHGFSHMANCLLGLLSSWFTVFVVSPLLTDIHRVSSCLFEGVVEL
jgi:hypothetical protein